MNNKNDKLYEQARARAQKNIGKSTNVSDKDIIIDQEKEITYYRNKIRELTRNIKEKTENESDFEKELEISVKEEEYLIKYNANADTVLLTMYINKIINEPEIDRIFKNNEFKIYNKTRIRKHIDRYEEVERIKELWQI